MDSYQVDVIKKTYLEQRVELDTLFDGLYENMMSYVGSDDSRAVAATNFLLHQKAQLRLMSSFIEDLRTGRIFKPGKKSRGQSKGKNGKKKEALVVGTGDLSQGALSETQAAVNSIAPNLQQPISYVEGQQFNYEI